MEEECSFSAIFLLGGCGEHWFDRYAVEVEIYRGNRSYRMYDRETGSEVASGSSGNGAYETFGSLWVHYGSAEDGGLNQEEYDVFRGIRWHSY